MTVFLNSWSAKEFYNTNTEAIIFHFILKNKQKNFLHDKYPMNKTKKQTRNWEWEGVILEQTCIMLFANFLY